MLLHRHHRLAATLRLPSSSLKRFTRTSRFLPHLFHSPENTSPDLSSSPPSLSLPDDLPLIHGYFSPTRLSSPRPDFTPSALAHRAKSAALLRLVESYRKHGHRGARLDPLDLAQRADVPALDPQRYGLKMEAGFEIREEFRSAVLPDEWVGEEGETYDVKGILNFGEGEQELTIEEIYAKLAKVYCDEVAYEVRFLSPPFCPDYVLTLLLPDEQFSHLTNLTERDFLENLLESSYAAPLTDEEQLAHWELLAKSESFDRFLAKRFPSVKRYGLEGGESMLTAIAEVLKQAQGEGVEEVVIGMPHRGRLVRDYSYPLPLPSNSLNFSLLHEQNLLTQLLDLDPRFVFRKMRGLPTLPASLPRSQFSDDVLSHLFVSTSYTPPAPPSSPPSSSAADLKPLKVHVLPNPSHLETVTPVALGFARALQIPFGSAGKDGGELGDKVLSLSIHGDAAFGGQGVVAESLNLAMLPHFNVGGTVHIVVNNQLGCVAFLPSPSFSFTDLLVNRAATPPQQSKAAPPSTPPTSQSSSPLQSST